MNSIACYYIDDSFIFFVRASKGFLSGKDIVKQILNLLRLD